MNRPRALPRILAEVRLPAALGALFGTERLIESRF
jgi:hypothetical protein